jgi:hypothetical protein
VGLGRRMGPVLTHPVLSNQFAAEACRRSDQLLPGNVGLEAA